MSQQGLLWNVHCISTVVLREKFNFKSAVIRSERSSCFIFFVGVQTQTSSRPNLLCLLNHAICNVNLPNTVETAFTFATREVRSCLLFSQELIFFLFSDERSELLSSFMEASSEIRRKIKFFLKAKQRMCQNMGGLRQW